MDLGRARLRKIGINNLHCAVHPHHGVIWTDGKVIYLAPVQVERHQVQNAASVKVGEFENVTSVHWSHATDADSCHMCVVHQNNVTVWRVSGALPKLNFKQVRKINVRPVPQGCLWNPQNDILCLLSRHQCSFYFRHDANKGSYAFPALESGSIACGCWSPDGRKLVVCVGAALLVYRWSNLNTAIDDFAATAWRIPGLEGKLTSIAPVLTDSVVVAAEIPLERLCKQQDVFRVPDSTGDSQNNSDGIIRPNKSSSVAESLLNLQQHVQTVADSRSSLTIVDLHDESHDPIKLSTVPLKGGLTPDILIYEKSSQCVVVGSNSQSQLHIYALLEKYLAYCGNIQLDKDQRPKGLCSMPTVFDDRGAALLILVGQRETQESALVLPSTDSEFRLSLKYIILKAGYNHHSRHNGRGDSIKEKSSGHSKSSSLTKSEKMQTNQVKNLSDPNVHKSSDNEEQQNQQEAQIQSPEDQIKIPIPPTEETLLESEELLVKPPVDDIIPKGKLVDELSSEPSHPESLEVDTVAFSSQPPSFNNTKLAATYSLNSVFNSRPDNKIDQAHPPLSDDTKEGEAVKEEDEKIDEIARSVLTSQVQLQPTPEEISQLDYISKKAVNRVTWSPQTQESYSTDTYSPFCSSQTPHNTPSQAYDVEDQVEISSTQAPTLLLTERAMFITSSQSELEPENTTISAYSERDSPSNLSSLQYEIKYEPAISSHNERDSPSNLSGLESEIEPQTTISSRSELDSPRYVSISQFELKSQPPISSKNERDSPSNLSSLEIKPLTTSISSQTETYSPVHGYISQPDMKPQTTSSSVQTEENSPDPVCELSIVATTQATPSSSLTKEDSSENFNNLQSGIKTQISSDSLQTPRDSPKHFYNLQSGLPTDSLRTETSDLNPSVRVHDLDHGKEDELSDLGFSSSQNSADLIWDALEKQAKSQKESIDALYNRLESLSITVDKTACVFPTNYQDITNPEMVEIFCEKPEGTETKRFLLDSGRLQLEPVKMAFGIATVELWLDGMPCVLGANIDGYIPLKFPPSSKLHISGRPVDR